MLKEFIKKYKNILLIVGAVLLVALPILGFYLGLQYQKNYALKSQGDDMDNKKQMEEDVSENDAQKADDEEEEADDSEEENEDSENDDEDGNDDDDDSAYYIDENTEFTGSAVEAELPDGWSIIEYFDGDGSDSLVEGVTYDGLTGLEIRHGAKIVFALRAVNGIGGISACSEVVQFDDTSSAYITDIVNEASAQGVTTTVTDFTTTEYSEFTIFSNRMRRVNYELYWDMDMTNRSFEPNCGLDGSAFPAYGLEFVTDRGTAMEADHTTYWYELNEATNEGELETLEDIFETLNSI